MCVYVCVVYHIYNLLFKLCGSISHISQGSSTLFRPPKVIAGTLCPPEFDPASFIYEL